MMPIWGTIATAIVCLVAGFISRLLIGRYRSIGTEHKARQLLKEAKREADTLRKEANLVAKDQMIMLRDDFEKSTKDKRQELNDLEQRISQREMNLERKVAMLDKKELALDEKLQGLEEKSQKLEEDGEQLEKLLVEERDKLQRIAGMTRDQARNELLARTEKEIQGEIGSLIRRLHEEAKETAEREATKIVALAVQRSAVNHSNEIMTCSVALPNDDMKGRIIGRDGRNIRALEAATGVNLLIDDTPEAVVISGFDPIRRETARQVLEQLIADGRIHPARIEEVVAKVQETMTDSILRTGEEAAFELDVQRADPELLRMLGRLKFRTSYTQNILQHSTEVGHLMGTMAAELHLDGILAKRIGVFHDIGKASDHEVEGSHAIIGADMLRRHGEPQLLVNAVAAHHEEVEPESVYAILCAAADAISGSRPGARSETTGIYLKRLEKLESVANSFSGVSRSYAIQAGREVRVIVEPDLIDDSQAMALARSVSRKIEEELQYPGQIRVTVIRETRCIEYAR